MKTTPQTILILSSNEDLSWMVKTELEAQGFRCHELFLASQLKHLLQTKVSEIHKVICLTSILDGSKKDIKVLCQHYRIDYSETL